MNEKRPSLNPPSRMVRKFRKDDSQVDVSTQHESPESSSWFREPFRDEYCFFYGSLMDPSTLTKVLQLREPPRMHRSRVIGYHVKLWGPYPALLDGPPLHPVHGMTCKIPSQKQCDQLQAYETDSYRLKSCLIELCDNAGGVERTVPGFTFMWNGDARELREGSFDLRDWVMEQKFPKSIPVCSREPWK